MPKTKDKPKLMQVDLANGMARLTCLIADSKKVKKGDTLILKAVPKLEWTVIHIYEHRSTESETHKKWLLSGGK